MVETPLHVGMGGRRQLVHLHQPRTQLARPVAFCIEGTLATEVEIDHHPQQHDHEHNGNPEFCRNTGQHDESSGLAQRK